MVDLVGWSQLGQVVGFRYAKPVLQGLAGRFGRFLVRQYRQSGISAGFWAVLQGFAHEGATAPRCFDVRADQGVLQEWYATLAVDRDQAVSARDGLRVKGVLDQAGRVTGVG